MGINSDSDRDKIKKLIKKEPITWRNWWNGGDTDGPIANQWQIENWPSIYILDANGVIRYKWTEGGDLDIEKFEQVIIGLLAEKR